MDPRRSLRAFVHDESGPTSVEYATMLALIAAVALVAVKALGETINRTWTELCEFLDGVMATTGLS